MKFRFVAGLTPIICACLAGALVLSGCASGPIDMVRADEAQADLVSAQAELRDSAVTLAELVETNGWRLAPTAGEQARSFLGRLIGGGGDTQAPQDDRVAAYLSAAAPASVSQDLEALTRRTGTVARRAREVAAVPQALSEDSLQNDIAAAETALGAVRGAHAFFTAANEQLDDAPAALGAELQALKQAEIALAEAADALAARRWSGAGESLTG